MLTNPVHDSLPMGMIKNFRRRPNKYLYVLVGQMPSLFTPKFNFLLALALSVVAAALPPLMAAILRFMFTAPHQQAWPHGSLRLINVSGLPAQVLNSQERADDLLQTLEHRDNDVWVVSYVKSGTTWTIGILAALWDHPAAKYAGHLQKTTRNFCPQPELPDLGWGDNGFGHSLQELNQWPTTAPQHRCFKSHWPSKDHVVSNGKSKFIYVMRNAQDQMTSHWNQVWGMGFHYGTEKVSFEGGWDVFFDDWIHGNAENGKWFHHVASWYRRRDDPDVLWLRYEELQQNSSEAIRRIANFVGGVNDNDLTEEEVTKISNITSFRTMRKADKQDWGLWVMRFLGVLRRAHVRQGKIGSGRSRFSTAQLAALEQEYDRTLKPLGMPRDWVLLS